MTLSSAAVLCWGAAFGAGCCAAGSCALWSWPAGWAAPRRYDAVAAGPAGPAGPCAAAGPAQPAASAAAEHRARPERRTDSARKLVMAGPPILFLFRAVLP